VPADRVEMSVTNERVVDLLSDLIAIPSVNPVYDAASPGEGDVSRYVEAWASGLGLQVLREPVFPGRGNVTVTLPGPEGGPVLAFEAHMDTVGVDGMPHAFAPDLRDGRLYGRGACDTKGSLAVMMAAFEELATDRASLSCTVQLVAAVDEETSGKGARAWVDAGHRADAAIIGEPTGCRVVNRHNGCVRGRIVVTGKAAHTSVAREGVNAIDAMAEAVLALRQVDAALAGRPGGARANGSLTVTLISGGAGINVVPERCEIQYDRRIVPGQRGEDALAEIDAALDTVRRERPDVRIEREEPWLLGDSLGTDPASPIAAMAAEACRAVGIEPDLQQVPYGSDASKFEAGGIPALVFGPGDIANAHAVGEYVPIDDLRQAVAFYREVALAFGRDRGA
jgi:acetylornithine deacetylase